LSRRNIIFTSVVALGLLADQLSKAWIASNLPLFSGQIDIVPGFISLVHAQNKGAAFGMLRDFEYRQVLFAVFTLVALGVIADLFRRLPQHATFMPAALGLILSGALGNSLDRIRQQYVTDFIKVEAGFEPLQIWLLNTFHTTQWPSFNIADAALVVGVGMFLVDYVLLEPRRSRSVPATATDEKPGSASAAETQPGSSTPSAPSVPRAEPAQAPAPSDEQAAEQLKGADDEATDENVATPDHEGPAPLAPEAGAPALEPDVADDDEATLRPVERTVAPITPGTPDEDAETKKPVERVASPPATDPVPPEPMSSAEVEKVDDEITEKTD
jgi:signal peptidase II